MPTLAVRPVVPQDEIFLYELYSEIRTPEFAHAPITASQREYLIRMQFRSQMSAYSQQFPNSVCHVVLLDGNPIGRFWVARREDDFYLVDIALSPKLQSKGIGTVLIQRLQQEAIQANLPIRCSVFRMNTGSLRFHKRLGFGVIREDQMQYFLEWQPLRLV